MSSIPITRNQPANGGGTRLPGSQTKFNAWRWLGLGTERQPPPPKSGNFCREQSQVEYPTLSTARVPGVVASRVLLVVCVFVSLRETTPAAVLGVVRAPVASARACRPPREHGAHSEAAGFSETGKRIVWRRSKNATKRSSARRFCSHGFAWTGITTSHKNKYPLHSFFMMLEQKI